MNNDLALKIETNFRSQEFKKRIHEFAESTKEWGGCDKCNHPVPPENNAAILDFILSGSTDWTLYFASNRHLEPVADGWGIVICEGSPSRFQKINGIPDSRPEYRDGSKQDKLYLEVWQWMQQELKPNPHVEKEPLLIS